eukprot:gene11905-2170_t
MAHGCEQLRPVDASCRQSPLHHPCDVPIFILPLQPQVEETSLALTTLYELEERTMDWRCLQDSGTGGTCNYTFVTQGSRSFVKAPEDWTIRIKHSVFGTSHDYALDHLAMSGAALVDHDDHCVLDLNDCRNVSGCQEGRRNGDILYISELLLAAGVTLDNVNTAKYPKETYRDSGSILLLQIKYSNDGHELEDMQYKYKVSRLEGADSKIEQVIWGGNESLVTQQVINRHTLRIIAVQTGEIGQFNFQELLKTLVTALALLKIAKIVVELIVIRVLPHRKVYKNYSTITTVDFSDIKKAQSKDENGLDVWVVRSKKHSVEYQMIPKDFIYGTYF